MALAGLLALGVAAAPGAGGAIGDPVRVEAQVAQLLEARAQPALIAVDVDQGGVSRPVALRVDVRSNLAGGYAARIVRSALLRGDLSLALAGVPTEDPQLVLDLGTVPTALPAGTARALGHRTGTISAAAGDRWGLRVTVAALGCPATGLHVGTLDVVARAGSLERIARVLVLVDVQRNRRLCR